MSNYFRHNIQRAVHYAASRIATCKFQVLAFLFDKPILRNRHIHANHV
jgi:hypothetical protein